MSSVCHVANCQKEVGDVIDGELDPLFIIAHYR